MKKKNQKKKKKKKEEEEEDEKRGKETKHIFQKQETKAILCCRHVLMCHRNMQLVFNHTAARRMTY
jgi:muramoyltetrapeptide carboxypeptidase LdcA involved in peptidoglycan recycling